VRDLFSPEGWSALRGLASRPALVAFDFDGTLAPIARHHSAARMRARTRDLLAEVARLYPCAILSGRARGDLRRRLAGVGVRWLVGNHGAEAVRGAGAELRGRVARWTRTVSSRLRDEPGVEVEPKGLSVSVHYRASRRPAAAHAAILEAARDLEGVRIQEGKRVVNLLGRDAPHKGDALAALVRRTGVRAVLFAGDDVTDEDAFGADLGADALTVRIGPCRSTRAAFHVGGQAAVDRLLEALVGLRRERCPRAVTHNDPVTADEPPGFLEDLWALVHALETASKQMHRRLGVTGPQRLLARAIGSRPGCSPAEAARELRAHPASVTRLVAGLESLRLVRRRRHPVDGRSVVLELTARGKEVARLRAGTIEEVVVGELAGWEPGRVADARALLRRVTMALARSPLGPGGRRRGRGPAGRRRPVPRGRVPRRDRRLR
jgi:trehalose 6-phosphate phosphatase